MLPIGSLTHDNPGLESPWYESWSQKPLSLSVDRVVDHLGKVYRWLNYAFMYSLTYGLYNHIWILIIILLIQENSPFNNAYAQFTYESSHMHPVQYMPVLWTHGYASLHDDVIKWKHFHVTGPLCGEFTGYRWFPRTKASDEELWCFLWSAPE